MAKKDLKISASILAADLSNLETEIKKLDSAGVDMVHIDVMDGVFVDNISYGNNIVSAIRAHTKSCFDTHLMVIDPTKLIPLFAKAGSDIITIHLESKCDIGKCIELIHQNKMLAGLAINPDTPAEKVFPYMEKADMILVMTVEPGYGGQGFDYKTLPKIEQICKYADKNRLNTDIQVDGGINATTAALVKTAGANILVAGTYLFDSENMKKALADLK